MTLNYTINLACIAAWIFLLLLPSFFLLFRWPNKYKSLEGFFNDRSLELYFKLFKPSIVDIKDRNYKDFFKENYYATYGRKNYIVPLLMFAFVSLVGIYALDRTIVKYFIPTSGFSILPPLALSAFLGAYMWIGFDQIKRIRTQDLTFHDIHRWSFRFLISIPIGYAFSYSVKEPIGLPIAFFLGALPLRTIIRYSKRFVDKNLKLGDKGEIEPSELQNLQGIEKLEAERLQEEGITNILQLAYYDPIDLTHRTTFDFFYIIDIKSQSLLWIYIGNKLNNKLRAMGLRSAHEAVILTQMLKSNDEKKVETADKNIEEISNHIGLTKRSFIKTLHEIVDDPHTLFIFEVWCPEEFDSCFSNDV